MSIAALFPRAVGTFVGRVLESHRIDELLDAETLYLVYGVGGVGKSELVYRAIERARARQPWTDASAILLEVQPGDTAERVLTLLRARLGVVPVEGAPRSRDTGIDDDLAQTARALDAAPCFVFIDDVHHLDSVTAARMFAYLSRYVRSSRIFAASRLEVPLSPDAPPPVITRLDALDQQAATEMVGLLARRLGIAEPDAAAVFESSRGSPFHIQRAIATLARSAVPGTDSLDATLRALPTQVRDVLLLASVTRGRLGIDDLRQGAPDTGAFDAAVHELVGRFLVDVDRDVVIVHDLVHDALLRVVDDADLLAAKTTAAGLFMSRFSASGARHVVDVVEAVHLLTACADYAQAWQLIETHYRRVAALGLDHLFIADLDALRTEVPQHRVAIELLSARVLVRRSRIDEAQVTLARVAEDQTASRTYRYLLLAGEVAQRTGDLVRAATLFSRARESAERKVEAFQAGLQLAATSCVRGDGGGARLVLDALADEADSLSPRHRARLAWMRTLSFGLEEEHEAASDVASEARAALDEHGLDDLVARLAMLEIASRVEIDDMVQARELLDRVLSLAEAAGALREPVAAMYQGVVEFGEGDVRAARVSLDRAFDYLERHRDTVYAGIAGRFMACLLLASGELVSGDDIAMRTERQAGAAGLDSLTARVIADSARLRLAAGELDAARVRARESLEYALSPVHGRVLALVTLARADAVAGHAEAARDYLAQARAQVEHYVNPARMIEIDLEHAEIAPMIGEARAAIELAERARARYAERGRNYMEARACVALAGAYVARGGDADVVLAEAALGRARDLATERGYRRLTLRVALTEAAVLARGGDRTGARERLTGAFRGAGTLTRSLDAAAVRIALQAVEEADAPPGIRTMLGALGLVDPTDIVVAEPRGRRAATIDDLDRIKRDYDLVVEVDRGFITGCGGAASVKGRPITCKLLAALIEAHPDGIAAEELYTTVWGGAEYHPLRHRNTLYVALNRLRRTLGELFDSRDLVERTNDGWRLIDGVTACTIGR